MANEEQQFQKDVFKAKESRQTLRRFIKALAPQRLRLFIVAFCVCCQGIFQILAPLYSAQIIDTVWNGIKAAKAAGDAFQITWEQGGSQLVILLVLYLSSGLFSIAYNMLMSSFAEKLSLQFRLELASKLNRLPLSYFDGNKPGEIMSRFTNDLDKVSEVMQSSALFLLLSIVKIVGAVFFMLRFNVKLTLVFLVFMLPSLLITKAISGRTLKISEEQQDRAGEFNGAIEESFSGRAIIAAFGREKQNTEDIRKSTRSLSDATRRLIFVLNAIYPVLKLANDLGTVVMAIFGSIMLMQGGITPGVFQAFFQYASSVSRPLTDIFYIFNNLQSALGSMERVYTLLDEPEISPDPPVSETPLAARGDVSFVHASFGYSPEKTLMKDICFEAKKGQKIAIVGSTGAGKTTLINLLMRFYELKGGKILLDGIETAKMNRSELRSNFGMVLQDTWLFEGTVAENIAYGRPEATREEIISAAKTAQADFFIRTMPEGYDTMLSNDASNISVGQRQLLTIARVVLCDPAILILDEATSSVDTYTEVEISRAMRRLMKNRTSFVIAHRLSTVVDADLILMMQDGDIIAHGSHSELLAQNGAYAELYNSQFD